MASIRRRPSGTWSVLFRMAGKQTSASFPDEVAARRFLALIDAVGLDRAIEIELNTEPEPPAAPAGPTLAEYLDRHIDELTSATPASKENYRQYVDALRGGVGSHQLDKVSQRDIQAWIAAMQEKGRAGKTIKNHLAFVAGALNAAVERGELTANPCKGVRAVSSARKIEPVFLTAAQVRTIATACGPHEGLVMWLAGTGMRYSEATALLVGDVDQKAGTVRVNKAWKREPGKGMVLGSTKTRRSTRTINIGATILAAVADDLARPADELLFQNTIGERVNIDSFRSWYWTPAVKGMKPRPRIHDLRHTCASWMIAGGQPLPAIQAHLGHESITTTVGTYGHLDRAAGERAAAAIDAALGEPPATGR